MKAYTFKDLVIKLSEVRSKENLEALCIDIDYSYQRDRITYKDNETLYNIINNVVKREYID